MNSYSDQDITKPLLKNIHIVNNGHHNMTVKMEYDMNSDSIVHYLNPGPDLYKIEFFSKQHNKGSDRYVPCIVIGPITEVYVSEDNNERDSYIKIDSSVKNDFAISKIFIEDIREIIKL